MHSIKSIAIAAIGIAFSALVSIAQAAPVTVPVGLNPGDQYRLVFVTSTTRDATSANLADYNAFVTAAANSVSELAALGANWRAIASTAGNPNARTNTNTDFAVDGAGVKIFLLDGTTIVADDNQDLWDGTLDNAINRDESGAVLAGSGFPDAGVWTGTSFTGVVSPGGGGSAVYRTGRWWGIITARPLPGCSSHLPGLTPSITSTGFPMSSPLRSFQNRALWRSSVWVLPVSV
jgi:hypothetical protein